MYNFEITDKKRTDFPIQGTDRNTNERPRDMGLNLYILGCRAVLSIMVAFAAVAIEGNRPFLFQLLVLAALYTTLAGRRWYYCG